MRRWQLVAAGAVVVLVVLAISQLFVGPGGFLRGRVSDRVNDQGGDTDGPALQVEPPAYSSMADTAPTTDSPITVAGDRPASDYTLTLDISPPADAVRMQVSPSVSMSDVPWLPVENRIRIDVASAGYQMVFVRFELADGALSPIWTAGGEVDPTFAAATSSAEGGPHQPSWIRPFSATELVIRVEAGRLQRGSLEPYDLDDPPAGDTVRSGPIPTVERNSEVYGFGVSGRRDVIRRADRLLGRPLDIDEATSSPWMITSEDGSVTSIRPSAIKYVSRPTARGSGATGPDIWEVVHDVVVSLPGPLEPGRSYQIEPAGSIATTTFVYDPTVNLSPAVRVTQVGFAPKDAPKVAYLSGWFDGIGDSALPATGTTRGFTVVDVATRAELFRGTSTLRYVEGAGTRVEDGDRNQPGLLNGSTVHELDFSAVVSVGRYQVCVDDVGCSEPFAIDAGVWGDLTATVARAAYHQRSGTSLGAPYTSLVRPRPYHPDDGVRVDSSDYTLLSARFDSDLFEKLAAADTGEAAPNAWGGHFDAGDWDRRIYHLWYARTAAQLVELFPERFAGADMNIPESGDGVPDLLDEALWSLDLYRRMQREDGAISGGIEASEHPQPNSTSWVDDLAVFAYEPDAYSTYLYAGVAAEMAAAIEHYASDRSADYLESALRAMAWAESQQPSGGGSPEHADAIAGQRTVAAAALLVATGDRRWHELFLEAAEFRDQVEPDLACHEHVACDAAWLYLQGDPAVTDAAVRQEFIERFVRSADAIVEAAEANGYGWTTEHPGVPYIWGLGAGGAPHTSGLLRAHLLTGDGRYREVALRSALVSLGANPLNRSMITGVGREPVRHPLIVDVENGGLPLWPGTPVYGYHDLGWSTDDDWIGESILGPGGAQPDPTTLPYLWQWYDVPLVAAFNEFTLHQSHAEALWTFGVLSATSGAAAATTP